VDAETRHRGLAASKAFAGVVVSGERRRRSLFARFEMRKRPRKTLEDLLGEHDGNELCRFNGREWNVSTLRGALAHYLERDAYATKTGSIIFHHDAAGNTATARIRFASS